MTKKPEQRAPSGDGYKELKSIEESLIEIEKNKTEGTKEKIKQEVEKIKQACLEVSGKVLNLIDNAKNKVEKNKAIKLLDFVVDLKKTADIFKDGKEMNTEKIKEKLVVVQEQIKHVGGVKSEKKKPESVKKISKQIEEASAEDMARYGGKGEQKPPEKQEEVQVDNNIDSNKEENEKKEKEALIFAAKNKEDLFAALDKIGEVKGSSRTYSTEEIKDAIEALFAGVVIAGKGVTRELGIRDKAEELLKKEKTPKNKKDIIEKAENRKTINKEEFKKIIDEIKTAQGLIDFLNSAPGWIDAGDGLFNFADDKSVENNVKKVKEGFLVGFGKEYKAGYLPEILKNKIEEIRNSKKTRLKKINTETVKSDNDLVAESQPEPKPESKSTPQPESQPEPKPESKSTPQPDLVPKEKIEARQKIRIEKIKIGKPSEGKEGIRTIKENTLEKPKSDEVQKPTEKKKPFDRAAAFTSIIDFMDEREFKKQKKEVRGEIDAIRMMLEANNIDLLKKYFKNGNLEEDTKNIFRADARFKWVFELMGETEEKKVEDNGVLAREKGGERISSAKAEIIQKAENESKKAQEYAAEIKKVQSEESDESKLKWLLNGALGIGKMAPNMVYKVVGTVLGFKAGTDLAMYAAGEALGKVTGKEHVWGDYAEHKKGEREIPEEQKRLYKLFDEYVASFRQAKLDKMEGKSDKEVTQNLKKSIAELYKFIDNNRYIDPKEKNLFKDRLNAIANDFNQENQEITEQQQEEVKKLAEAFLANKISKVQITRDWANLALACTPLTMLRIGTIAAGSVADRFRKGALEYNKKSKTEMEAKQESKFAHRLKFMTIDAAADWGAAIAGGHTRSTQKLENRKHGGKYDYDKQIDTLNEVKKELKNKTYEDYVEECKNKGIKATMEEKQFDDWKKASLQKLTKKLSGTSMAKAGIFGKAVGQTLVGAGLVGLAINADSLANVEWHDATTNFSNNVDKGLDALQLKPFRDLADRYWSGDSSSTVNVEISNEYDQIEKVRQLIYKDYGFDPADALSQNIDINELGVGDFIQLGKDLQELRETGVSVEAIRAIMADGIQEGELENLFQLADAFKENPDMLAQFNHHLEGGG
ncbi:MAG TPA: procyclic acidic repetitive family protein, partial [Candidatus Magasanikbacteria bacterium]|nr:procyclic acidic repetitive family protein [Candidatus Magasanikbacteria bacterium]